jgi:DNA mismatch repair protein MutS
VVRFNSPELHEEAAAWSKPARTRLAAEAAHAEELTRLADRVGLAHRRDRAEAIARIDVAASHAAARGGRRLVQARMLPTSHS